MLDRERLIDLCDVDAIEQLGVEASLTQTEFKAKLFDQYTQAHTTFNPKKLEASSKHFYNYGDRAQCELFADKFMDQVESVFALHHRDYALQFFIHLSPTFLKRPKDLDRFR